MRATVRRLGIYALPFAMAVAGAFVLGEIYVRMTYDYMVPPPWQAERSLRYAPAVFARHVFPAEEQVKSEVPDVTYRINSLGYRGADFAFEKPSGTTRIMFYGGSSVFDPWLTEGEDWPHQVGAVLREAGATDIEVINAGIPGHATFDAVGRLLTEGHLLKPDFVVLSDSWNDIKHFRQTEPVLRSLKPLSSTADPRFRYHNFVDRLLGNYSQLYVRARQQYYTWKLNIGPEGHIEEMEPTSELGAIGPAQYRLDVAAFVDIARDAGIEPVLVIEPHLAAADNSEAVRERIYYQYVGLTHEGLLAAYARIEQILRDIAAEKGVLLIDASTGISGRDAYFVDHVHLTADGSRAMARAVAEGLAPRLSRLGVAAN